MASISTLPKYWLEKSDWEDTKDKVEATLRLTPSERIDQMVALCRLAVEQIEQQADPYETYAWEDPLSEESKALLSGLRDRYQQR